MNKKKPAFAIVIIVLIAAAIYGKAIAAKRSNRCALN